MTSALLRMIVYFALGLLPLSNAHAQFQIDVNVAGENWGAGDGLFMFRGNPNRNFYGTGPFSSETPTTVWRYPERPMCASSCVGQTCSQWCGTGWTGQPVVRENARGPTEVIFGAYDRNVHFVNAETGRPVRPPFPTGDIIKGSVTLDPDGFPLLYFGSRDNKFRIVSLDGATARELWSIDGNDAKPRVWNDDWDGNGVIAKDHLFIGGENSWFYIFKLNRSLSSDGKVSVRPVKIFEFPAFSNELAQLTGDRMTSIESSPVIHKDRVYITNSAGYVVGFDISKLEERKVEKVFEFWAGDDIDASPVVDKDGFLYIAVELELDGVRSRTASAQQVRNMGQLIKLDPYKPSLPLREQVRPAAQHPNVVWKLDIPGRPGQKGGIWSTPALDVQRGILFVTTHPGDLKAVDTRNGREIWNHSLGSHEWSSPVLINDKLLVGRCLRTGLQLFDVSNLTRITSVWTTLEPRGCVESTPAVWRGRIFVGSRDGYFYGFSPMQGRN